MSGVNLPDGTRIRKGAVDAVGRYVQTMGGSIPSDLQEQTEKVSAWAARLWRCRKTTVFWASFT